VSKLEAKSMEPNARQRDARRAVVRAVEPIAARADERDHDDADAQEPSQHDRAACMMTLAEELGRLAADLYAEGKL
jgi:hypothetical protein